MNAWELAYLAEGKLRVRGGSGGPVRVVESAFARSMRERTSQIHQRHAWKMQGPGAQFMMGMLWPGKDLDSNEAAISITSVCRGRGEGELLYTLESNEISGIFALDGAGVEQRLFHTADFSVRQIALSPDRESMAASVLHRNFCSNISVLRVDGADFYEATEGDSVDMAPQWAPGPGRRIVFQSAGVGRTASGQFSSLSPFTVEQLDLGTGVLQRLAGQDGYDLINPRIDDSGALHYIRRPHVPPRHAASPVQALRDAVLFPFRLSFAIFQFFNFFSMRYTGKPLVSPRGSVARQDPRQSSIPGDPRGMGHAALDGESDPDAPAASPSWELVRLHANGSTEVLAKRVLCFDLLPNGSVVYSDGSSVDYIPSGSNKAERVLVGRQIWQVAVI